MHLDYYDKLVRDRIPEIIEKNGNDCHTTVLNDEEYFVKLDEKLAEEVGEFRESHDLEELADILEVVRAIAAARGSSIEAVEAIREKKRGERGGFEKRIRLNAIRVNDKPVRREIPTELLNVVDARRTEITE